MDKKFLAIGVVAIIIAAAAVAVIMMNSGDKEPEITGLSVVGRVNSEGSGILLAEKEDPAAYITPTDEKPGLGAAYIYNETEKIYYVFNVEQWGGKVFATPGAATIQHVQLMDLAAMMHLKFVSYTEGSALSNDTLYYVAGVPSFAEFQNKEKTAPLAGFIIWEAQYSVGITNGYKPLALTNDLFDGHTCCIIGASNKYLSKDANTLMAFFDVYIKAVDKINVALADTSSEDYKTLIAISKARVSMPDGMTDDEKMATIVEALNNVTYLYADDSSGSLDHLKADIAELAESLYDAKQINKSAQDLGFSSYDQLAQKFVDDSFMKKALSGQFTPLSAKKTINVAAISGDIHQIALWFAKDTGMFEQANLNIEVFSQNNGPAVYGLLSNGEADIGFLGAPPMTIRCMNAEDIHA